MKDQPTEDRVTKVTVMIREIGTLGHSWVEVNWDNINYLSASVRSEKVGEAAAMAFNTIRERLEDNGKR